MIQEGLLSFLQTHPATKYYLAYSGGLDSHVLLHTSAALQAQHPQAFQFQAIHIHHGLQASADAWVVHAEQTCAALNLPLKVIYLNLKPAAGESIEAIARQARYQALSECLAANEMLLTAHHQDDQAETFLLNALRGSGSAGLAAMPQLRALGAGQLGRPLLAFSRAQLAAYAQQYQLQYVDDPSNAQIQFDRNYLRHAILPHLQERWPAVSQTLSRAANWQAEQQQVLERLLVAQLPQFVGSQAHTLSATAVNTQDGFMQKALVRYWLQSQGFTKTDAKKLQHILNDVFRSSMDATPCVAWGTCEVRRYRGDVYALKAFSRHDAKQIIVWADWEQDLYLPSLERSLSKGLLTNELKQEAVALNLAITVGFRQGGERVERAHDHSLELKNLFQKAGIPPWERERVPLIYLGEQLRLVVGIYPKS